jgi:putative flippase GtrA
MISIVRFILVGVVNVCISLLIFSLLIFFNYSYGMALLISYLVGVLIGFIFNKSWVFKSTASNIIFLKYFACYSVTYFLNLQALNALVLNNILDPIKAQVILVSIFAFINFYLIKSFVFRS